MGAGVGESVEGVAGFDQLGDLAVDGGDAGPRELAGAGAVVGRVEVEQLLDLGEREAGGLGAANEAQALEVDLAVAAHRARRPRGFGEQPATLIISDGFDPTPAAAASPPMVSEFFA